jgi:hypothetical protein
LELEEIEGQEFEEQEADSEEDSYVSEDDHINDDDAPRNSKRSKKGNGVMLT